MYIVSPKNMHTVFLAFVMLAVWTNFNIFTARFYI